MRDVHILDAWQGRFGRRGLTLEALAEEAAAPLVARHGPDALVVANQCAELLNDGGSLAPRIAEALELTGVPAWRVEAGPASGAAALHQAAQAVRAGVYGRVLVVGVERLTHVSTRAALAALSTMLDDSERRLGATPMALAALMAREYMAAHGLSRQALADVSVWAHEAAMGDERAHLRRAISSADVLASAEVASPLHVLDAAPVSDGAAAVVVASEGTTRILGMGHATDAVALARRGASGLVGFSATRRAATRAFIEARRAPSDVNVLEVHDAFSVLQLIALEDLGFAKAGGAHAWLADNRSRVNARGGLKARGHPTGATGVAQVVELVAQLSGEAGERQVPDARVGLAHNVGGVGTNVLVTLLEAIR